MENQLVALKDDVTVADSLDSWLAGLSIGWSTYSLKDWNFTVFLEMNRLG